MILTSQQRIALRGMGIIALYLMLLFYVMIITACAAKHIDPPTYTYDTPTLVKLSAEAHAKSVDGVVYLVADTHSMEPVLWGGDYIVVNPHTLFAELQGGQVITYQADWTAKDAPPVTHRLALKQGDGWILSGDNVAHSESSWRVSETNYIGLVVGIYRLKK